MAKVDSLFTVRGNLGGSNFYVRGGKMFARNVSSLDGTRVKTDPRFKRTRESNREFAGATLVVKEFRKSLNSLGQLFKGDKVSNRLFIIIRRLMRDGIGARGMRTINVVSKKDMLSGFEFSIKTPVAEVLPLNCSMAANAERNEVTLTVPAFHPVTTLKTSEVPTHFAIHLIAAVLPNFEYNKSLAVYEAVNPSFVGVFAESTSGKLIMEDEVSAPLVIKAQIKEAAKLPDTCALVGIMAVQFFQEVNGVMYPLSKDTCMKIHSVF